MTIDTMTIDIVVDETPIMMIETITMIQVTMMDTKGTTNCDGVVPLVNVIQHMVSLAYSETVKVVSSLSTFSSNYLLVVSKSIKLDY